MGNRYGEDIEGMWVDMVKEANFNEKIDKPRLRASLLAGNSNRVLLGNMGYNFTNDAVNGAPAIDYSATEYDAVRPVQNWPTTPNQMAGIATTLVAIGGLIAFLNFHSGQNVIGGKTIGPDLVQPAQVPAEGSPPVDGTSDKDIKPEKKNDVFFAVP